MEVKNMQRTTEISNHFNFYRKITNSKNIGPIEAFELHLKEIFNLYTNDKLSDDFSGLPSEMEKKPPQPERKSSKNQVKVSSGTAKKLGIPKMRFLRYLQGMQLLISERIFKALDVTNSGVLTYEEFAEPMLVLKQGTIDAVISLLYSIIDCQRKSFVTISDLQLIFSYIPTAQNIKENRFSRQLDSYSDNIDLVNKTFPKMTEITSKKWKEGLIANPTLFLVFYSYIYESIPCLLKPLHIYKLKYTRSTSSSSNCLKSQDKFINPGITIKGIEGSNAYNLPKRKNVTQDIKMRANVDCEAIPVQVKKRCETTLLEMVSEKIVSNDEHLQCFSNDSGFFFKQKGIDENYENFEGKKGASALKSLYDTDDLVEESEEDKLKKNIKLETEAFIKSGITKDGEPILASVYLVVLDNSIYFYKDNKCDFDNYYKTCNLTGSHVKELPQKTYSFGKYFNFNIIFQNEEVEDIFHPEEKKVRNFVKVLRESINYKNFFCEYVLVRMLGEGSYGEVYIAENSKTKDKVATKILKKNKTKEENWRKSKNEIDIMKRITCPYIVEVIDFYENSEYYFLVMEYFKCGSLTSYIEFKDFKIKERICSGIIYQIGKAIEYLHSLGIIHRDIKPDNIMLSNDNQEHHDKQMRVKLIDFGLSKILCTGETLTECSGSLLFSAPEVLSKRPYSFEVDIWSLGINIFYILTGNFPFKIQEEKSKVINTICNEDFNFDLVLGKSSALRDLLKRSLTKDQKKRIKITDFLNHPWFEKAKAVFN